MGILQNAVNQMLGTVGIAARLSPNYEAKQKEYEAKKELGLFERQAESEMGVEDYESQKAEKLERIAKINPSQKNVDEYMEQLNVAAEEKSTGARAAEARKKVAEEQEAKRAQEERYKAFVDMFTEGGRWK